MKRFLPILLIVGCTTQAPKHDAVSEAKKPEAKKPEVTQLKKPTPPAKKQEVKPEVKPEVKDLEKEVVIPPIEEVLLKRQTLFAVACEQHPVVKGLAKQYQRAIVKFTDSKPTRRDSALVVVNYLLKTGDDKPVAQVICNVNETARDGKPNYIIDAVLLNGIKIK